MQQFLTKDEANTLQRAAQGLRAKGDNMSPSDDPYGGLMLHEDAEVIEALLERDGWKT